LLTAAVTTCRWVPIIPVGNPSFNSKSNTLDS
jgi:hypothetical protein